MPSQVDFACVPFFMMSDAPLICMSTLSIVVPSQRLAEILPAMLLMPVVSSSVSRTPEMMPVVAVLRSAEYLCVTTAWLIVSFSVWPESERLSATVPLAPETHRSSTT